MNISDNKDQQGINKELKSVEDPGEEKAREPNEVLGKESHQSQNSDLKTQKTPLILKILAVLLIIVAVTALPSIVPVVIAAVTAPLEVANDLGAAANDLGAVTFVISAVHALLLLASGIGGAIFGINLLRNKRRNARRISDVLIALTIATMLCELMLDGLGILLLTYLIRLVIFIAVATYIDPTLSEERKVQRKLRKMETHDEAEEGTLGRDVSGKGYLRLDFFNIFWIFVVACVFGVIVETIYYAIMYGGYQDRAGMLFGPFSPIYGFGALLMTFALNRLYKKSILVVFILSALIGGAFEYAVSWFMEFSFGIVAWDYSDTFLSIDGRTNGMYMFFWGVLGCLWIKLFLPYVLKLVNVIPWDKRYVITTVCAAVMITNGFFTLAALDSWYKRQADQETTSALEGFCNTYFDDRFMEDRFQTMSIDPDRSTRM